MELDVEGQDDREMGLVVSAAEEESVDLPVARDLSKFPSLVHVPISSGFQFSPACFARIAALASLGVESIADEWERVRIEKI